MTVTVVNKVQSLNLFASCCGRKKLSFQIRVVFHRTALSAPCELSQLELTCFSSAFVSTHFFALL